MKRFLYHPTLDAIVRVGVIKALIHTSVGRTCESTSPVRQCFGTCPKINQVSLAYLACLACPFRKIAQIPEPL